MNGRLPLKRCAAAFAAAALMTASTAWANLREDVQRLVRSASLRSATIAVSIRDADAGAVLVSHNDRVPMTPASNMKLLTTGAALHGLGADFVFTTRLLRDGDKLIVVGDGDPAFGDPELIAQMASPDGQPLTIERFLELWVEPVRKAGITRISEIVVDDRVFDRDFAHATWPADQLNKSYCAQVSGLNFHLNTLHFYPRPRPGEAPAITDVRPAAPWLKVSNGGTSRSASKDRNDAWLARKIGTNELIFKGNVRFGYKVPVPVTVHDMPEFFGHLLADRLRKAGVAVDDHRVISSEDPVSSGTPIAPLVTTPIATAITRCNRDSENIYAESLLKRTGFALTGQPGSWISGGAIVRHILHERLRDPDLLSGVVIADGSGLSQENKITARMMTAWLNSLAGDDELGPVFLESLAVAGESGTLKSRYRSASLRGASVQAKTGYINGVSCLSGYVTMPDGRRRSFSVLVNGLGPGAVSAAKTLQDQIVAAIAEDMATAPAVTMGGD